MKPPTERVARAAAALLDALAAETGTQGLLDAGRELLGFPLHLLDPGFALLAKSGGDGLGDPRWLDYADGGAISEDRLRDIRESGFLAEVQKTRRPTIDPGRDGNPDIIACDVMGGGRLVGRLGVWATGPYGEDEVEIVRILARTLAVELRRRGEAGGVAREGDYFLSRLLSGRPLSAPEAEELRARMALDLGGELRVLAARDSGGSGEAAVPLYVRDRLLALFPGAPATVRDETAVLLLSRGVLADAGGPQAQALRSLAKRGDLRCGLSRPFAEPALAAEALRQALSALKEASAEEPLALYEDAFLGDLLRLCAQAGADLPSLVWPPLARLRAYDAEYRTDYCASLRVFLDTGFNAAAAARILGIHYNTAKYRLDVMRQELREDPAQPEAQFKLRFSFAAYDLLEGEGKTGRGSK